MVTLCAPARPTCLPKKPAIRQPASGASGTARRSAGEIVMSGPLGRPKGLTRPRGGQRTQ